MTAFDIADLVAVAARVLAVDTQEALRLVDLPAATSALASPTWQRDAHQVAAALIIGVVRHRPFPHDNRRIAVLTALQYLGLRGYHLDLDPPSAARALIDRVVAGSYDQQAVADWIAPRLRPRPRKERGMLRRFRRAPQCEPLPIPSGKHLPQFTERGRAAVLAAQTEAVRMSHDHVGTEHLLVGLLREEDGVAAKALTRLAVTLPDTRAQIEEILGHGTSTDTDPPFTPRSHKVLELAAREAKRLGHPAVGTEHLLLALVREGEGLAAQILHTLGADRSALVRAVMDLLDLASPERRQRRQQMVMGELETLFAENERLHAEVDRLHRLLRQHGIEPGDARSA